MRKKSIYGLLIIVTLLFCLCVAPSTNAASAEEEVLQVATNFTEAFSNSDFKLMSSLHWKSPNISKFFPGKEGAFLLQGWEAIGRDWKTTLEYPPGTYMLSPRNQQATMLGKDVAVATQYLIYIYSDPTTKEQTVSQFRQTLVVQKIGGKWLIVHEHSSVLPIE
jgi:ketosteroid isomerase-like protein